MANERPRKADIYFSSSPKIGGKNQCSRLKAVRQEECSLIQGRVNLPIIVRPSAVWMRATHIRKDNLLYSVYQVFSHPKILFQAHLEKVSQQLWASQVGPGRLTRTISHPRVRLDKTKIIMPRKPNI